LGNKENDRLYCDSESAIHLAKNLAFHSKTNHIQHSKDEFWKKAMNEELDQIEKNEELNFYLSN
jgi:hypothetical protein